MKHHERNISELGLSTLKELLVQIDLPPSAGVVQQFYAAFFISLVRSLLSIAALSSLAAIEESVQLLWMLIRAGALCSDCR